VDRSMRRSLLLSGMMSLHTAACAPPNAPAKSMRPAPTHTTVAGQRPNRSEAHENRQAARPVAPVAAPDAANRPTTLEAQTLQLPLSDLPSPLVILPAAVGTPVIVAGHGAGGSPEWQCEWLEELASGVSAVLVCLRGKPMLPYEHAYFYPEHHTLGKIFSETMTALGDILTRRRSVLHTYVGYSQGATMGALMLHEAVSVPPNLLLVEGGVEGWTDKRCRSFRARGGRRVFFACGTTSCARQAKGVVTRLRKAGVEAEVTWAQGAGHTPGGAVGELARAGLRWLLSEP
jgi:hypothetical protein